MSTTILTLTMNPALDTFLEVSRLEADRKLRALGPTYRAGGGGINVSRAVRRLRGVSTAVFPAGGWAGEMIEQLLERESIAAEVIPIAEATRQSINVTEGLTGSEYRLIVPGPALSILEWQQCLRAVRSFAPAPDYVVASGSLPPGVPADFFARLASIAREVGFRLIVDSSGEPLRHAFVAGTFLVKPNRRELALAADVSLAGGEEVEAIARGLAARSGVEAIVVSEGPGGATLADRHRAMRIAAPPADVVSRIGAGDSMVAGIVVALARGEALEDAVRYGVAAGTAAVTLPGHRLCTYEETARFAEAMHGAGSLAMA